MPMYYGSNVVLLVAVPKDAVLIRECKDLFPEQEAYLNKTIYVSITSVYLDMPNSVLRSYLSEC